MFSRSVTSAVSRAKSTPMVPSARTASCESRAPSERTRIMKNSSSSSSSSSIAVLPPSKPGCALGVEPHPAEAAAQVGRVDRGEAALGVGVEDPVADVERAVVLLGLLVLVQRLGVAEAPTDPHRAWGAGSRSWRALGGEAQVGHRETHSLTGRGQRPTTGRRCREISGQGAGLRSGSMVKEGQHIMLRVRPKSTWRRTTRYVVTADDHVKQSQGADALPTSRNPMM